MKTSSIVAVGIEPTRGVTARNPIVFMQRVCNMQLCVWGRGGGLRLNAMAVSKLKITCTLLIIQTQFPVHILHTDY